MRLIVFLLIPLTALSQCLPSNHPVEAGEEISYEVSYNWGPIWVDTGIVTFKVTLEQKKEVPAWHLVSTGRTYRSYDLFFKVRDTYDSWIDTATFRTLEFRRYIYEGGYQLQNTSWFDYNRRIVFSNTKRNDDPLAVDTLKMKDCTFDMLSSVYFVRSLDISSMPLNKKMPVFIAIDDSVFRIDIRYLGKEMIEHPEGVWNHCLKMSASMVEGTIFRKGQEAYVWVSDDLNKIPVYMEASILVGSVKAYLKEAKGLRYPRSAVSSEKIR
ncbi:MAG: DUF3108 domain-containing protein [bacterium]